MNRFLRSVVVFILFLAFANHCFSADITSNGSGGGTWATGSTWTGGVAPTSGDNAVIANGDIVTLGANGSITNCTVNTGGTLDASSFTLTVSGTFTLQSSATFKQGGTVTAPPGAARSFDNASNFIFNGSQTSISSYFTFGNLTWSSSSSAAPLGALTINGNLTLLNCNEFRGTSSGAKSHTVAGNVVIDGSAAVLVGPNGSSAGSSTWSITGNVTTQNSGILRGVNTLAPVSASSVYNIGGGLTNNGSIQIGSGSGPFTINFNGISSQSVTGNSLGTVTNITVNNSAGVTLGVGTDPTVTGTLTLTSGTLTNSSATLTLGNGSTISRSGGSLSTAPSVTSVNVTYTGSSSVTTGSEIPASSTALSDLTINNSAGVVLNASATVNGNLVFTNGKITLGSNNLTLGGGSSTITGASSSNYVVTNTTGYLIQNVGASNVTFPVGTSSTYNPVILNNSGGTVDNYSVRIAGSTADVSDATKVVGDQWTVNEATGSGSNVTATFQWNAGEEGSSFGGSRSSAQIGKYSGSGTVWNTVGTTISGSGPYTAVNTSALTATFSNSRFTVGLPAALPVELTSFSAAAHNSEVELVWSTATEVNNYGFEVERKTVNNEQSTINKWEKLGFVEGHGTSNAPQNYSFTDGSARVGKYSYRLKQIDRDGKVEYHKAVEVTIGVTPNTVWLDNNYPNPFNPSTRISFVLGTTGYASLKVYNLLGQEVATLANGLFNAGEVQESTFDATEYSSGIYYYELKSGDRTEMKKMLLLK